MRFPPGLLSDEGRHAMQGRRELSRSTGSSSLDREEGIAWLSCSGAAAVFAAFVFPIWVF
jgi:hypothetical protein